MCDYIYCNDWNRQSDIADDVYLRRNHNVRWALSKNVYGDRACLLLLLFIFCSNAKNKSQNIYHTTIKTLNVVKCIISIFNNIYFNASILHSREINAFFYGDVQ